MKTKKHFNPIVIIIAIFVFALGSCEKENSIDTKSNNFELYTSQHLNTAYNSNITFKSIGTCNETTFPLIAGQNYYAGDLVISSDGVNLYVSYLAVGDCKFTEFHLFIGDVNDVPLGGGNNPQIGHFTYTDEVPEGTDAYTFTIPLEDIPECFTLLAHTVCGEETIWAMDNEEDSFENLFGSSRWGWAIENCIEECEEDLILTAKIQLKNTLTASTTWGVLSTGTPSPLFSGWCDYMSVVDVEGTNTYDVIAPSYLGSIKIADMIVENTGGDLNVSFVTDIADNVIEWSYVFVGTEAELEAMTNECPDYLNFPYSHTEWSTQHDFTISLN